MKLLFPYFLTLAIIIISIVAWLTQFHGWLFPFELFSHFQAQYFIISFLIFLFLIITADKKLLLTAGFAVTLMGINIIPWYLTLPSNKIENETNFRILNYNVNFQNTNYEATLEMVKEENPNLAIFLEVDEMWIEKLNFLKKDFPYFLRPQAVSKRGIVIYSQFPLENTSTNLNGQSNYLILSADLNVNQTPIHLLAVHPAMPLISFQDRNQQLNQLETYLQSFDQPVIVAGDFNITMWSPYYRQLINQTGLKNARQGFGILPSWPTGSVYPLLTKLFSIPIDHCLVSSEIEVKGTHLGTNAGSDHFPLITDISFSQVKNKGEQMSTPTEN